MKKYLITGANGFCGRHFANLLTSKNKDIYGISRTIPHSLISQYPNVTFDQCNLLDYTSVYNILKKIKPDVIFHMAAESSVSTSWKSPINIMNNNTLSQINIFESIRELNIPTRIIIACSSEEYGLINNSDLPINENCSFNPLSTYAVSKVSQDMLAYQYHKSYDMDIIRVRSFNLTGPGRPPIYALSSFSKQIVEIEKNPTTNTISVGNLNVIRDYTDVRDAVNGYYNIALKAAPGSVYNLCSGTGYQLKELLNILISLSTTNINIKQDPSKFRPSDLPTMIGDNTKIKTDIDWSPKIPIQTTLNDLLQYWRNYNVKTY